VLIVYGTTEHPWRLRLRSCRNSSLKPERSACSRDFASAGVRTGQATAKFTRAVTLRWVSGEGRGGNSSGNNSSGRSVSENLVSDN
jgi:hypothetical protein